MYIQWSRKNYIYTFKLQSYYYSIVSKTIFFLSILKSFNLLNLTISMKNSDIGPLTDFICTIQSLNVKWWVPSIVAIKHH